jgi:hypothetical protein
MKKIIPIILLILTNCTDAYDRCVSANQKRDRGYLIAIVTCNSSSSSSTCSASAFNIAFNAINYPSYCDGSEK